MSLSSLKRNLKKYPLLFNSVKAAFNYAKWIVTYPKMRKGQKETQQKIAYAAHSKREVIWYFGVAVHPNLGDLAQTQCTLWWLKKSYPNAVVVEISSRQFNFSEKCFMAELKENVRREDLIFFQSGYTMTDHHEHERMRTQVLLSFPENRVTILPQTIHYSEDNCRKEAIETYKNRSNLLLLARDRVSFETAKQLFGITEIALYPDIVTTLIGTQTHKEDRNGVLFCIRDDYETLYKTSETSTLMEHVSKYTSVEKTDTTVKISNPENRSAVWQRIGKTIDEYSTYRVIVTDRYHGTIFSLIAGTPVVVLKTTDHKVVTGAEWFKPLYPDYVFVAKNLDEAEQLIEKVLHKNYDYQLSPYFTEHYYDKLSSLIARSEQPENM